jgi:hypothetical protein
VSDLQAWLAGRTPRPPDALALSVPDGPGSVAEQLTDAGVAALERALGEVGERRGAFELLAADALLTYACERAAGPRPEGGEAPDPEAELLRILELLERRGG